MRLHYEQVEHYGASYEITFLGKLNDIHWYAYDWSHNSITLCHDTDNDIIAFCKTLGDSLEVFIDGDRVECPLEVTANKSFGDDEAVYVTLELTPEDDAMYAGAYDTIRDVEVEA